MILTVQQRFEIDLPFSWRELPPAAVLATDDWIFEWVEESFVPVDHKADLLEALGYAASFALGKMQQGRSWIVIIDPSSGAVRGMASIATIELSDDVFPNYFVVGVPEIPLAGAIPWVTQTSEETLAGHPAIVVHDMGAYNFDANGPVIAERYVGTVFPDAGRTAVQLEILAEDIECFDDIVATGNLVLGGLRLADRELD